jgi:hypothetical protein
LIYRLSNKFGFRFSNLRHVLTSRASADSRTASTSSIVRQLFESRKMWLDVDQPEMIEQLHRRRDGRPPNVMIKAELGVALTPFRRSPASEAEPAELPLSCRHKHLRLDVSPRSSRNMQHLALSLAIDSFRRACIRFRQHREGIRHRRALCHGNARFGHIRRSCDLGRFGHGRSGDGHRRLGIEDNTLGPLAL